MADKVIMTRCRECGTFFDVKDGGLFKHATPCPKCGAKVRYEDLTGSKIACESCGRLLEMAIVKENRCPACKGAVQAELESRVVGCPFCAVPVKFRKGDRSVVCPNPRCARQFDPEAQMAAREAIVTSEKIDVELAEDMPPDQIFSRYPSNLLATDTMIHAESGMYAVVRQGTGTSLVVDEESVLLSDTALSKTARIYEGSSVPKVKAEVFYVRKTFNAWFKWGGACYVADEYGIETKYRMSGTVEIDCVTDPGRFLDRFGVDPKKVVVSAFGLTPPPDEQPGAFVPRLRSCVNDMIQAAMINMRDERGYSGKKLLSHKAEVLAELLRLANEQAAEYGLRLCSINAPVFEEMEDLLMKRLAGPIVWNLPVAVSAHQAEDSRATVDLKISGKLRVKIRDADRLNSSMEASLWANPKESEHIAHNDISSQAAAELQGRLAADIGLLVFQTKCDMAAIQSFQGSLVNKMMDSLNQPGGFFDERGLQARDVTVLIEVVGKSDVYLMREKLADEGSKAEVDRARSDLETQTHEHLNQNAVRVAQSDAQTTVQTIQAEDMKADALHESAKKALQRQEELDGMRRAISFDAWRDQQRREEAEDEANYARERRRQLAAQQSAEERKEHEARLFDIAQKIEESKLGWREKLEAYERLQRGVRFHDEMEERNAKALQEEREQRIRQQLRAEEMEILARLKDEEALRNEELAKQRFARELELRRQIMAEDAARLQVQFEREQAEAEAAERARKASDDIATLRLMLEHMAQVSGQQLTAENLRQAREQVEQERRKAEAASAAAAQASARSDVSERAMELLRQMAEVQNLFTRSGKASDADAMKPVMDQLRSIEQAVRTPVSPAVPLSDLKSWFDGLVARVSGAHAAPVAAPVGGRQIRCPGCGQYFDANAFFCPHCGRNV